MQKKKINTYTETENPNTIINFKLVIKNLPIVTFIKNWTQAKRTQRGQSMFESMIKIHNRGATTSNRCILETQSIPNGKCKINYDNRGT